MAQVPDINKVQAQGLASSAGPGSAADINNDTDKLRVSERLNQVRGQAGQSSAASGSSVKSLVEFLESVLGVKAPEEMDNYQKLEYLQSKIKELDPKAQIDILKQVDKNFGGGEKSPLHNTIKALKKDVLDSLKTKASADKAVAKELVADKEKLGALGVDKNQSGLDYIAPDHKFLDVQVGNKAVKKKPFEQILGFMVNFAEHQENFFSDSSFKISEFAAESDQSKNAYFVMREGQKFFEGEKGFLKDLKAAGKSMENQNELREAFRELMTLQVSMSSRFDMDFSDKKQVDRLAGERKEIAGQIDTAKSKIRELHTNM